MKWVKISERMPEEDGWYLWWDGNYYTELYYIVGRPFGHLYTHWLKITGPEDVEDVCEYRYTYDATTSDYESSCNYRLDVDEFRRYTHCPNCGRKIKEVKP